MVQGVSTMFVANDEFSTRTTLAGLIAARLQDDRSDLRKQWFSGRKVRSFVLDDLLPPELVQTIHAAFPQPERMMLKRSFRENKHVAAQMDQYDPALEYAVFAFQDPAVVREIAAITGLGGLEPDAELYAGGISAMAQGAYLRPHLDNSHDRTRARYRALNLLFYVTPGWSEEAGGSLQLWDEGPSGPPRTVPSLFNRLVVMATDRNSWHSVSEVVAPGPRCCVSNYYFSRQSPEADDYFHATSFRREHARGLGDLAMRADNALRTAVLKLTGNRLFRNPHVFRRGEGQDADS